MKLSFFAHHLIICKETLKNKKKKKKKKSFTTKINRNSLLLLKLAVSQCAVWKQDNFNYVTVQSSNFGPSINLKNKILSISFRLLI